MRARDDDAKRAGTTDVERMLPFVEPVLAAIRTVQDPAMSVPSARALLVERIRAMRSAAERGGLPTRDVDDAAYALVALADEVMLRRPGSRDAWLEGLLQLALFGENTAGEGVFARLARLRREPTRARVLLVYDLVLALGFRGRFAGSGEAARLELMEGVRADLVRFGAATEAPLSPSARLARPATRRPDHAVLVLATGVGALVLACGIWLAFALDLVVHLARVLPVS